MNTVLVTGAGGFLGYHVVKRLNAAGVRPRVLERPDAGGAIADTVEADVCAGHLDDLAAVRTACEGADTLFHLAFKVGVGGGASVLDEMRRVNVDATRSLLHVAAASAVRRVVVAGSALAVGVNRQPVPLDENASWAEHALDLPYASIRRDAEMAALALSTPEFAVVSVCPSLTFGPEDPVGAPANKLLERLARGKLRFTLPVGFGCLDVRDFADGAVRAADRGRPGERYLLSGENVTTEGLLRRAAAIAGVKAPSLSPPLLLVRAIVAAIAGVSRLRRKPPAITPDVLQVVNRYAWYDTAKARRELGWAPRPLDETLADTIAWLRHPRDRPAPDRLPAG